MGISLSVIVVVDRGTTVRVPFEYFVVYKRSIFAHPGLGDKSGG